MGAAAPWQHQPDAFDIVVTDLTMPHWTGLDLARRILARRPDIPIVLTTGHSGSWTQESIRALGLRGMEYSTNAGAGLWLGLNNFTNLLGNNQTITYQPPGTNGPAFYRGRVWLQ